MNYRTGYIPDPSDHRRTPFHHVRAVLAPIAASSSATLVGALPGVLDQGQTGSCTGHAVVCASYAALMIAGQPLGWVPSPAGAYTIGRAVDRVPNPDGSLPPLQDQGAMPNQVVRGINVWGVRPMMPLPDRYSDADPSTINDEPSLLQVEQDAQTLVVGDYEIFETGASRGAAVRTAISNGYPVCVAVPGGSAAWQTYVSGVIPSTGQPLDHYVTLFAYAQQSSGAYLYTIRNSWGDWGMQGDCYVGDAALQEFGDLIVMSVRKS